MKIIPSKNNKTYDKQKSFVNFYVTNSSSEAEVLNIVKKVLDEGKYTNGLNDYQKKIINNVKSDLNGKTKDRKKIFKLTPNIIDEIKLIENQDIPKYLFHRYRYDVFPETYQVDDYPPYLQIEPTSFCNYRCVFCFQTNKDFTNRSNGYMGRMRLETFKYVIDQARDKIEFISLASRGDPLVSPNIVKMLEYTNNKFLNLKINTNASVLSEKKCHAILKSGVRTIVFSADAADAELYSKLRVNGKLEKVISNIQRFKNIREKHYSKNKIITRVSGVKVSDQQNFDEMQKVWSQLVDQVAFVDYCQWENVYKMNINEIKKPCSELWRRMYIWWDGKANPCEVDYRSKLSPGNLKNLNLSKLWNSSLYQSLRKKHLSSKRADVKPCDRCTVV